MKKETLPPPTQSESEEFDYNLLTGHNRTDGSYKSSEELRMQYIQLTDELIRKMTDGTEVYNPETQKREKHIPDTVIFLDKSARPIAWFVDELWDKLAPEPGSDDIPKMPDFKFLNIDREQWVNTVDPEGKGYMDINTIHPTVIRSLRSIFTDPQYKQDGLVEAIEDAPSQLDGKTVLIVDEVRSTGRTLDIAEKFVQRAFPSARVGGAHWMGSLTTLGAAVGNADLPVWYKEKDESGRGVGNRLANPGDSDIQNLTQKLGAWFLSTRFPEVDQKALQLRAELKHLAAQPDVPIRPSNYRDDYIERLEELNRQPFDDIQKDISRILGKPLGPRK